MADRDAEDKVDVMELVTDDAMSSRISPGCCEAPLGVSKREARFPISCDWARIRSRSSRISACRVSVVV